MKNKQKTIARSLAIAGAFFAGTASAQASAAMVVASETTQPIGHYELCQRLPSECRALRSNVAEIRLTQSSWSRIIEVNAAVNSMIKPVTDQDLWGKEEVWSYPTNTGDCEDYVLLKRKLLMKAGIAENNLLITVVRQRDGSGHAVLTVVTDRGDFVLDNLSGEVRLWNETSYVFLKRQAATHSGRWVGIEDNNNPSVAALK